MDEKSERNTEATNSHLEIFVRKMKESDVKPMVFWGTSIESVLPKLSFMFFTLFTWTLQNWVMAQTNNNKLLKKIIQASTGAEDQE